MSLRTFLTVLGSSIVFILFSSVSIAHTQDDTICETVISEALIDTATNCAASDTNTVCYGSEQLLGELNVDNGVEAEDFDEPGELLALEDVLALDLEPLQERANDEFIIGVSVLTAQLNLPVNYPQNARLFALGDVDISDAVTEEQLFETSEQTIDVTTTAEVELRAALTFTDPEESDPAGYGEVIQVPSGVTVPADAISEDGDWVRVIYDEYPGWLPVEAIEGVDLSDLPRYRTGDNASFTRYQSLNLETNRFASECGESADTVLIQGTQRAAVDLAVNCITLRLDPVTVILLNSTPNGNDTSTVRITTLMGISRIFPDTDGEILVPLGTTASVTVDNICSVLDQTGPSVVSANFLEQMFIANSLPGNLRNFGIMLPVITIPSGIGQPLIRIILNNPILAGIVRQACEDGDLPDQICQAFGF